MFVIPRGLLPTPVDASLRPKLPPNFQVEGSQYGTTILKEAQNNRGISVSTTSRDLPLNEPNTSPSLSDRVRALLSRQTATTVSTSDSSEDSDDEFLRLMRRPELKCYSPSGRLLVPTEVQPARLAPVSPIILGDHNSEGSDTSLDLEREIALEIDVLLSANSPLQQENIVISSIPTDSAGNSPNESHISAPIASIDDATLRPLGGGVGVWGRAWEEIVARAGMNDDEPPSALAHPAASNVAFTSTRPSDARHEDIREESSGKKDEKMGENAEIRGYAWLDETQRYKKLPIVDLDGAAERDGELEQRSDAGEGVGQGGEAAGAGSLRRGETGAAAAMGTTTNGTSTGGGIGAGTGTGMVAASENSESVGVRGEIASLVSQLQKQIQQRSAQREERELEKSMEKKNENGKDEARQGELAGERDKRRAKGNAVSNSASTAARTTPAGMANANGNTRGGDGSDGNVSNTASGGDGGVDVDGADGAWWRLSVAATPATALYQGTHDHSMSGMDKGTGSRMSDDAGTNASKGPGMSVLWRKYEDILTPYWDIDNDDNHNGKNDGHVEANNSATSGDDSHDGEQSTLRRYLRVIEAVNRKKTQKIGEYGFTKDVLRSSDDISKADEKNTQKDAYGQDEESKNIDDNPPPSGKTLSNPEKDNIFPDNHISELRMRMQRADISGHISRCHRRDQHVVAAMRSLMSRMDASGKLQRGLRLRRKQIEEERAKAAKREQEERLRVERERRDRAEKEELERKRKEREAEEARVRDEQARQLREWERHERLRQENALKVKKMRVCMSHADRRNYEKRAKRQLLQREMELALERERKAREEEEERQRQQLLYQKKLERGVLVCQSLWRGKLARRRVNRLRYERHKRIQEEQELLERQKRMYALQCSAAVSIQRYWRGHRCRVHTHPQARSHILHTRACRLERASAAVVKIQALYRGYRTRKKIKKARLEAELRGVDLWEVWESEREVNAVLQELENMVFPDFDEIPKGEETVLLRRVKAPSTSENNAYGGVTHDNDGGTSTTAVGGVANAVREAMYGALSARSQRDHRRHDDGGSGGGAVQGWGTPYNGDHTSSYSSSSSASVQPVMSASVQPSAPTSTQPSVSAVANAWGITNPATLAALRKKQAKMQKHQRNKVGYGGRDYERHADRQDKQEKSEKQDQGERRHERQDGTERHARYQPGEKMGMHVGVGVVPGSLTAHTPSHVYPHPSSFLASSADTPSLSSAAASTSSSAAASASGSAPTRMLSRGHGVAVGKNTFLESPAATPVPITNHYAASNSIPSATAASHYSASSAAATPVSMPAGYYPANNNMSVLAAAGVHVPSEKSYLRNSSDSPSHPSQQYPSSHQQSQLHQQQQQQHPVLGFATPIDATSSTNTNTSNTRVSRLPSRVLSRRSTAHASVTHPHNPFPSTSTSTSTAPLASGTPSSASSPAAPTYTAAYTNGTVAATIKNTTVSSSAGAPAAGPAFDPVSLAARNRALAQRQAAGSAPAAHSSATTTAAPLSSSSSNSVSKSSTATSTSSTTAASAPTRTTATHYTSHATSYTTPNADMASARGSARGMNTRTTMGNNRDGKSAGNEKESGFISPATAFSAQNPYQARDNPYRTPVMAPPQATAPANPYQSNPYTQITKNPYQLAQNPYSTAMNVNPYQQSRTNPYMANTTSGQSRAHSTTPGGHAQADECGRFDDIPPQYADLPPELRAKHKTTLAAMARAPPGGSASTMGFYGAPLSTQSVRAQQGGK